jgi:predicted transcriptional regulator
MTTNKRSKVDIYSAIFDSICKESATTRERKASPTRVARRANISYDRFQKILDHLVEVDMVSRTDDGLEITEKGLKCFQEIKRTNAVLRRLGLSL